ncbi:L-arabinokinase [Leucoagaricus sp. SymC.cos]|nr:L-arabinokinase [Leucoagaricus sp. SymC.cos]
MLDRERTWLTETGVNCILSDAAFLGCLAAKSAGIPSILITNFTFDSVYSYLATTLVDSPAQSSITPSSSTLSPSPSTATDTSISSSGSEQLLPDVPIPEATLAPLVSQLHEGYQHADLLLRLPGHIPIPSFLSQPALPSPQWVDPVSNKFHGSVISHLLSSLTTDSSLHSPKSFPNPDLNIPRSVRAAPLLVRPPSSGIYTPEGRAEFLQKTGLPNFPGMKILVVSFGGQVFKRPGGSRTTSRMQSRSPSQEALAISGLPPDSVTEGRLSSKRSSREYCGLPVTSASLDKIALRPRDMNLRLDLDAIDKGLRTHIKSESSGDAKYSTCLGNRNPYHSDENTSDYRSSDADNGGSSSQAESDHDVLPNKDTRVVVPFDRNTASITSTSTSTNSINFISNADETIVSATAATAKRRHTLPRRRHHSHDLSAHRKRLATPSHLLIPGAPPATKPVNTILRTPSLGRSPGGRMPSNLREQEGGVALPEMCVIPPTPKPSMLRNGRIEAGVNAFFTLENLAYPTTSAEASPTNQESDQRHSSGEAESGEEADVGLLPDENWIAVICGVSKEQWNAENQEGELPEGFYVAPRDVYMPDLIAVGDVVLGKLGYGMTSECVDACTPFVYVSRPLFIEEHGLRMYLGQEGVGIELSRAGYEGGEWARSVEEAYCKGWEMKETKRRKEFDFCMKMKKLDEEGVDPKDERRLSERERQGREMARDVVEWVDRVREQMTRREGRDVGLEQISDAVFPDVSVPVWAAEVAAKGIVVA